MRMPRFLPAEISSEDFGEQFVLSLTIAPGDILVWGAALSLLFSGLVRKIAAKAAEGSTTLILSAGDEPITLLDFGRQPVRAKLTRTDLETLTAFVLRCYRDGVAEVDHLDFEAEDGCKRTYGCYLTVQFLKVRPPVSEAEARRRLGL
jgi:hypothetical protein